MYLQDDHYELLLVLLFSVIGTNIVFWIYKYYPILHNNNLLEDKTMKNIIPLDFYNSRHEKLYILEKNLCAAYLCTTTW